MSRRPQQQSHARPNPPPPPHASYGSSSSGTYQYQPHQQYQESGRGPAPHAYNHPPSYQNGYGPNGYGGYPQPPPNAEIQLWEWFTTVDTDRSDNAPLLGEIVPLTWALLRAYRGLILCISNGFPPPFRFRLSSPSFDSLPPFAQIRRNIGFRAPKGLGEWRLDS